MIFDGFLKKSVSEIFPKSYGDLENFMLLCLRVIECSGTPLILTLFWPNFNPTFNIELFFDLTRTIVKI